MSTVGQAIGGIVGGAVGFFVGGPTGALYGAQLGMMAGGYLDPPKGPVLKGPRLSDLTVQTSTYGAPLPRIYGTVGTFGNIIWLENNQLKEVVRKSTQGGKGGGPTSTVENYEYFATFALGLCDTTKTGPIAGVKRIWIGGTLFYNAGSDDPGTIAASNQASGLFRVYDGSETQLADPRMQADLGIDNCPAHRGLAYIVFYDLPLANYGNSLMGAQVKVEIVDALEDQLTSHTVPMIHYGHSHVSGPAANFVAVGSVIAFETYSILSLANKYSLEVIKHQFNGTLLDTFYDSTREIFYAAVSAGDRVYSSQTGAFLYLAEPMTGTKIKVGNGLAVSSDIVGGLGVMYVYVYRQDSAESLSPNYSINMLDINEGFSENRDHAPTFYIDGELVIWSYTRVLQIGYTSSEVLFDYTGGPAGHKITGMVTDGESVFVSCEETGQNDFVAQVVEGALVKLFDIPSSSMLCDYDTDSRSFITNHQVLTHDGDLRFEFIDPDLPGTLAIMANGFVWMPLPGTTPSTIVAEYISSEPADLRTILENECMQSNMLTMADIDATAIDQAVRGYRVSDTGAIRAAIEPLQGAWPFDVVQRGYQIVFVPRGSSSVATIPAQSLDARQESDSPGTQITISNEMDTQLPRRVQVRYMDAVREYDIAEQAQEKTATESINIRDIEIAVVLNADEAAGMAEVLLYMYWLERRDVSFKLPPDYRALEPADVITITGEWGIYSLRLTQIHLLSDGRLECKAKYNSAAIYTPTAKGEEGGAIPSEEVPLKGPSIYALLDIPLLADENNLPGWPMAMAGYTEGWPGGTIYRSADDGQTWASIQSFNSPVTMGTTRGTISTGRVDVVDSSSLLQVDLLSGELSSIDLLTLLNGGNVFAYGAPGRWEIASARTVELQADGSYILSDWLRGRFGTEWAMATHSAGDSIVLLSDPDVTFVTVPSATIGAELQYRGITAGASIDSDTTREETYNAVNLEPLSGVYAGGYRDVTTQDWAITWIRRGRLSPEWRNYVDVPVGETTEAYEIDIYNGASVVRTLTSSTPSVTYTAAQQTADFGTSQATLVVKIYQMSETVGRGYPLEATLDSTAPTVAYVAASSVVYSSVTSQIKTIPSSVLTGDLLLALVMHRDTITPPAGWALVSSQSCFNTGLTTTQWNSVYSKIALPGDANTNTTWGQASAVRMAVQIAAFRKAGGCSVLNSTKVFENDAPSLTAIAYSPITATAVGQLAVVSGTMIIAGTPQSTPLTAVPGTQISPADVVDNRLGVAYVQVANGATVTGGFNMTFAANSTASVSVLIG
jgi:hypothetical protein